jgi:hypothetical protein
MMKKKAKGKTTATKAAKKKSTTKRSRAKKQVNPAEVRNDIAKIVRSGAKKITKAVMDQAMTGQLAPAKYLFEVAAIYPPSTDGSDATADEDCLAKTLLDRLNIPDKPVGRDEGHEPVRVANPSMGAAAGADTGEKESNTQRGQQDGSEPEACTVGTETMDVSVLL